MASVAQIGDSLILSKASYASTTRLNTIITGARQLFMRGHYLQSFTVLLRPDHWSQLSFEQYLHWSNEVWLLMWDLATRRGQARFLTEWLERKKPLGAKERFSKQEDGRMLTLEAEKRGSVRSIKRRVLEAAEAMVSRHIRTMTLHL